jgi:hypothetical protein
MIASFDDHNYLSKRFILGSIFILILFFLNIFQISLSFISIPVYLFSIFTLIFFYILIISLNIVIILMFFKRISLFNDQNDHIDEEKYIYNN